MIQPLICPVCIDDSVHPIMRDVKFSGCIDDSLYPVRGFVAFSCWHGHVFLIMSNEADVEEAHRGTSLVVQL